ncbi:MAG: J domain-containing protein, partial [Myxococcaceae bacterium]|nr:J domain-containing protein [Myxococcaceae bacterium]
GGGPGPGPGAKPPVVTAAAPMAGPGTRAQVVTSAAPAAKPAAAPAAPAAPAAKPDLAAELPALRKIFGALKDQNHFEVLGLTQTADGAQAKSAYFKLARTYHPDTVPGDAPPEYAKLKADIFARIGEAQRTLTDDKLRAEYVELLKSGGADQVDVAKILAAEELFNRATILVKARKFAEAVKVLDEVIAAMPDEGEYYAWRGYAKFFAAVDKRAAHPVAMADINLCLKRNDKVAQAWYFQGHMAKVLNDLSGAKRHFQRCVALNPNHLDAQRELRLMK